MSQNTAAVVSFQKATRKATERRTAWTGLSDEELKRPGAALMVQLIRKANANGFNLKELADELGVTYGYIAQLRGGLRQIKLIGDEFIEACSRFLDVPKLAVKVWAGKLDASDLLQSKEVLVMRLDEALSFIAADPLLGCWMPITVRNMSYEEKFFIVLCFQQATGYELLDPAPSLSFVQDYLASLPGYVPDDTAD